MNILLLTNLYPNEKDKNPDITKVCAFFAREWVKQGHKVTVIVNSTAFPKPYYFIGNFAKKIVSRYYNLSEIPKSMWSEPFEYDDFGVRVINMPMLKFIPKGKFFDSVFKNQEEKIKRKLKEIGFVPDIITGHWANPQIRLVANLAKHYSVKSAIVLHADYTKELCERYEVNSYIDKIDNFGFRSKSAAENAKTYLNLIKEPFVCYSGIPEKFISSSIDIRNKNFGSNKVKMITASRLLDWKNIDTVIDAANEALRDIDFCYDIVGDGPMMETLKEQAKNSSVADKIHFSGKVSRDEVQKKMAENMIYVMISHETFGLVYLESMLQGCIVIASRFGGIDGIVVDGENGFLCEEGNSEELAEIFKKIINLPEEEKKRIAENAIATAKMYTDANVAKMYLESIVG